MSDTQQGSDWWMASDGKWYPPSAQPGSAPPPPGVAAPVPYAPAPAAAAGYGHPPASTSGKATAVLVLGIVSLVLIFGCGLGIIPAFVALIMAGVARAEIRQSGGRLQGLGQIKAGVICSWITVAVVSLTFLIYVVAGIASSR